MRFGKAAGAAYRALTGRKDGPSLYDICDSLLLNPATGDPHLAMSYQRRRLPNWTRARG